MAVLHIRDPHSNPVAREQEILRQLWAAGISRKGQIRLTIARRHLFLDGYVDNLEEKLRIEKACLDCASGDTVVNRLRIAAEEVGMP